MCVSKNYLTKGNQERIIECFHAGERGTVGRYLEKEYRCNVTGQQDDKGPLAASGLPQNGEQCPEEEEGSDGEKLFCTSVANPQPGKT